MLERIEDTIDRWFEQLVILMLVGMTCFSLARAGVQDVVPAWPADEDPGVYTGYGDPTVAQDVIVDE